MVCMRDKERSGWSHVGICRSTSRVREDTLMTSDHTAIQVCSSGYGRAGIGRSSWKALNTGRHEKAPVRYPCSRLDTLHGAPGTHRFVLHDDDGHLCRHNQVAWSTMTCRECKPAPTSRKEP